MNNSAVQGPGGNPPGAFSEVRQMLHAKDPPRDAGAAMQQARNLPTSIDRIHLQAVKATQPGPGATTVAKRTAESTPELVIDAKPPLQKSKQSALQAYNTVQSYSR